MANPVRHARSARPSAAASRGRTATRWLALALPLGLAASVAAAEICKYADPSGAIHYTNVPPDKSWRKLSCANGDEPQRKTGGGATPASRGTAAATPPGFPRVDTATQKGRDDVRRKVLADELASEEKLLGEARLAYADGAPTPLPEEKADAEKYRQRIARLRQTVGLHEKNIEALKKEIANVK
jgi:hypothetical protein